MNNIVVVDSWLSIIYKWWTHSMISGRAASECTDTWHKPAKEASTNYTLSASKGH